MKVLLIENETLVRIGLRTILSEQEDIQIVAVYKNGVKVA